MARLTFAFRNRSALQVILGRRDVRLKQEVKREVTQSGTRLFFDGQANCPVDTGFMRDHLRLRFTPAGFAYDVGWNRNDFEPGLAFYPLFVVHGTRRMGGNPFLDLAWKREQPKFTRGVRAAIARAMRRRG